MDEKNETFLVMRLLMHPTYFICHLHKLKEKKSMKAIIVILVLVLGVFGCNLEDKSINTKVLTQLLQFS